MRTESWYYIVISTVLVLLLLVSGCGIPDKEDKGGSYFSIPKQIVADWSPYQDLLGAANAENSIDWNRGGKPYQDVCTISFAAVELKLHLEQSLGLNVEAKLPKDFDGEPSIILLLASDPRISGFLSAAEALEAKLIPDQGYLIIPKSPHLVITASSRVGILYGVYGLLERLGFRWFSPGSLWNYVPVIDTNAKMRWEEVCDAPSFEFRGFWNWGCPDQDFILWTVRNRFNLIGGIEPALAAKLGLHLWVGGHDGIQKALASDPLLFNEHPEYFGQRQGKRQPIQPQGSYFNPCFSNIEMANYVADYIANQIDVGDYKGASFLNIWPTDSRFASSYCQCDQCRALGNPTDHLLFFYQKILERLKDLQASGHLKDQVKICGISYYSTWDEPDFKRIETLSDDYFHIFYLNQRSFSEPVFMQHNKGDNNAKIASAIEQWMELVVQTEVKFGVCEYYNYSIYGGLAKTFQDVISADLKAYHALGCDFFAYMHPLKSDPGPRRLTNRLLSSLTWDIQLTGEDIEKDYLVKMYPGIEKEIREAYSLLDNALSNIKEIFGEDGLSYNLFQEYYWSSPPYTANQILEYIPRYLEGGNQYLPGKFSATKDYEASFVGLEQSMVQLQQCLSQFEELSRRPSLDSCVRGRLRADIEWCRVSYFRYSLLWNLAKWRLLKASSPESPRLEVFAQEFRKALNFLKSTPLLNQTISPVSQRETAIGWSENTKVIRPK